MAADEEKPVSAMSSGGATAAQMQKHMGQGAAWMMGMRVVERLLGFISTVIVVRLLTPDDFGLFAIATLVILFSERMGEAGRGLAIIRHPDPTREYMDSAWTTYILVSLVLGTLVVFSAPLVALAFNEPRAELLVYVLAIRVYMMGFSNIGVVMFRKELDFAKDFKLGIYTKLISIVVTITLVLVFMNYWALVIGSLIVSFLTICVTYYVHPFRPRFCFTKMREVWSFSGWVVISSIGSFFNMRGDRFVIGAMASTLSMGYYHIGADLGRMVIADIIQPISRALEPSYSKLTHSKGELKDAYLNVLSVFAIYCFGAGIGFTFVAEDFIVLVYGEKWRVAADVASWIVIATSITVLIDSVRTVKLVVGHSRDIALLNWFHFSVLLIAFFLFARFADDLLQIAAVRTLVALLVIPAFFYVVMRLLPIRTAELVKILWRPAFSALAMTIGLTLIPNRFLGPSILPNLLLQVLAGAAVYCSVLFILWHVTGRPPGAERALLRYVKSKTLNRQQ